MFCLYLLHLYDCFLGVAPQRVMMSSLNLSQYYYLIDLLALFPWSLWSVFHITRIP